MCIVGEKEIERDDVAVSASVIFHYFPSISPHPHSKLLVQRIRALLYGVCTTYHLSHIFGIVNYSGR